MKDIRKVTGSVKAPWGRKKNEFLHWMGMRKQYWCYDQARYYFFGVDFWCWPGTCAGKVRSPRRSKVHRSGNISPMLKARSERERMSEVKHPGVSTGAYALVRLMAESASLSGWCMYAGRLRNGRHRLAVPCGDRRDFNFARHFTSPLRISLAPVIMERK